MPSEPSKVIEHKGIIKEIKDDRIIVELERITACEKCHAKEVCGLSNTESKTVEVKRLDHNLLVGEHVTVALSQSLGYKALFLGYLLPFIILIAALFISSHITHSEIKSGIISLLIVILYYMVLKLCGDRLKNTFKFTIRE